MVVGGLLGSLRSFGWEVLSVCGTFEIVDSS